MTGIRYSRIRQHLERRGKRGKTPRRGEHGNPILKYSCVTSWKGAWERERYKTKINTPCCLSTPTSKSGNCHARYSPEQKINIFAGHLHSNTPSPASICFVTMELALSTQSNAASHMLALTFTARSGDTTLIQGFLCGTKHSQMKWLDSRGGHLLSNGPDSHDRPCVLTVHLHTNLVELLMWNKSQSP